MDGMKASDWDKSASAYAKAAVESPSQIPCRAMMAAINGALSFSSAESILDLGSGPGTAISIMFDRYGNQLPQEARIIASDFSQGMVDKIKASKASNISSNKNADLWTRLETTVLDAQDLSAIATDSMTHVMANLVYFMVPDFRKALAEARRVIRRGDGVFACTSWTFDIEWVKKLITAAQRVRPSQTFNIQDLWPTQWSTTSSVQELLESAGFQSVRTQYVRFRWNIANPDEHAQYMIRSSNMRQSLIKDFTEQELDSCAKEFLSILKENDNMWRGVAVLAIGM